jgi:hypothetical protein
MDGVGIGDIEMVVNNGELEAKTLGRGRCNVRKRRCVSQRWNVVC